MSPVQVFAPTARGSGIPEVIFGSKSCGGWACVRADSSLAGISCLDLHSSACLLLNGISSFHTIGLTK